MTQGQALSVMLAGESVFLTGPPGAGKTYVLNQYVKMAVRSGKTVAVTASTGIAATHIGGTTIHSWSGLGIRDFLGARDLQQLANNAKLEKRYNATDVLVIDEVSMLHGYRLDMVNTVCKLLRKSEKPFGGLQVILVGDLFQLPPITRGSEVLDFAHLSLAWKELSPKICYLSEQHRQQGDGLLDLLEAMRRGEFEDLHQEIIDSRLGQRPHADLPVTKLYAHNVDIDSVNQRHLNAINTDVYEYEMETKGPAAKVETLKRGILAPEFLELKNGAEVMFVANNPSGGFVNGSRGQVVDFKDDQPVVRLIGSGRYITVQPHSWKLEEDGKVRAEVSQLPLRLAWAITIHKSQGMSLDAAEIDLSRSFTPGMGYVALSRVRSLDGLYLAGINAMALKMHPTIYELDRELKAASEELALTTEEFTESEATEAPVPAGNPELLAALKAWRLEEARRRSVPSYVIAHDTVLEQVAQNPPQSKQKLLGIKGFGPKKLEDYGQAVMDIVGKHAKVVADEPEQKSESDFAALRAETVAQYPKAFSRWQPEEKELLLDLFWQGTPMDHVCALLERQPAGVWAQLHALLSSQE
jgi:ATP-dependent DNA helicase PIF1